MGSQTDKNLSKMFTNFYTWLAIFICLCINVSTSAICKMLELSTKTCSDWCFIVENIWWCSAMNICTDSQELLPRQKRAKCNQNDTVTQYKGNKWPSCWGLWINSHWTHQLQCHHYHDKTHWIILWNILVMGLPPSPSISGLHLNNLGAPQWGGVFVFFPINFYKEKKMLLQYS